MINDWVKLITSGSWESSLNICRPCEDWSWHTLTTTFIISPEIAGTVNIGIEIEGPNLR